MYHKNPETTLLTDASKTGLGAVLEDQQEDLSLRVNQSSISMP